MNKAIVLICLVLGSFTLGVGQRADRDAMSMVDGNATNPTRALYHNLNEIAAKGVMFGHQDDLAYGVEWKDWYKRRSDVNDVCGKFPAVYGWELSKLGKDELNIDSVSFSHMKGWIKQAYKMGGVNTISWHMDNFVNGLSSWDVGDNVVSTMLPGGMNHQAYKDKLDHFAEFVNDLKVGFIFKKPIPIVFRPFHEHTGSWFWWGADFCSAEEYKEIWRFTVEYLRDEKELHNIIWAYSPDIFNSKEHYLERYPGDEWVDLLGLDDYHDVGATGNIDDLTRRLIMLVELAQEKGKVAALTETGYEAIPDPKWWTDKLLSGITADPIASKIAWALVWRNGRPDHHYAPYPGHLSAPDFIEFCNDPITIFAEDLGNMYK